MALALQFSTSKHSTPFLVSDYLGLLFFQQEIYDKRNISMKIYSFFISFSMLIFQSFYFVSLEDSLGNLATYGGHSFEEDGMYGVDVWVEDQLLTLAMNTLVYPKTMNAQWLSIPDFEEFIDNNPNQYYSMISSYADVLQLLSSGTLLIWQLAA